MNEERKEQGSNEKKITGAKEGEGKAPGWSWGWKEEERKVEGGTSERREEEAEEFSPCPSPDSCTPVPR